MLTEEDRYVLIQDYLKGRLSGDSLAEFESQMKEDVAFLEEVNIHRIANEAVTDFYLLQVKDSVQTILKQKANQNQWPKWGVGLGICALSVSLLCTFYTNDKVSDPSVKVTQKVSVSKEEAKMVKPEERESPAHKSLSPIANRNIKSTKVEKHFAETPKPQVDEPIVAPVVATSAEQKSVLLDQEKLVMTAKRETATSVIPAPVPSVPEKKEPDTTPQPRLKSVDLVFNPLIGEEASFPMDETYNGELLIFDVNGTVIFRSVVQNGYPNRWDGRLNTGGSAISGQYGFVMKDLTGKEVLQGFITVAR